MYQPNLKSVDLLVPEIIAIASTPTATFAEIFNGLPFRSIHRRGTGGAEGAVAVPTKLLGEQVVQYLLLILNNKKLTQ